MKTTDIFGDFNTTLLKTDRMSRQNIGKDKKGLITPPTNLTKLACTSTDPLHPQN